MSESRRTWVGIEPVTVVRVTGADRVDLLQRLSTNDVARLARPGAVFSTVFTTEKGRIVDWVAVLTRTDDLLLRCSPGRAEGVRAWIDRYTIMEDVVTDDVTARFVEVVVDGPAAFRAFGEPAQGTFVEAGDLLVTRGLPAFAARVEVLAPVAARDALIEQAVAAGAERAGDGVFERLRLEAGVPSPEHEFREEVNPLELRLGTVAMDLGKGCFVGQEVLQRIESYDKLARVLVGFEAEARLDPTAELKLSRDERPLGRITSVLPLADGRSVGLAIVRRDGAAPGPAAIQVGGSTVAARLVDRPFWAGR
jgi:folate-binding protein YgfZ